MNCKDLGIDPCRHCKFTGHVCIVEDTDRRYIAWPQYRRELLKIELKEGIFYDDDIREDEAEVLRCISALIKAKYKDLEHLLILL